MSKKVTTAVAIAGASIPEVIEVLNQKLAALKHIEECVYKTNGEMKPFGNVKDEMKVENLIRMYSSIRSREKAYNAAAEELGLTTYPVFSDNGTAADWKQDILLRKAIIEQKETLDKLNDFKAKASKFVSEEQQQQMLLKEMSDFFAKK